MQATTSSSEGPSKPTSLESEGCTFLGYGKNILPGSQDAEDLSDYVVIPSPVIHTRRKVDPDDEGWASVDETDGKLWPVDSKSGDDIHNMHNAGGGHLQAGVVAANQPLQVIPQGHTAMQATMSSSEGPSVPTLLDFMKLMQTESEGREFLGYRMNVRDATDWSDHVALPEFTVLHTQRKVDPEDERWATADETDGELWLVHNESGNAIHMDLSKKRMMVYGDPCTNTWTLSKPPDQSQIPCIVGTDLSGWASIEGGYSPYVFLKYKVCVPGEDIRTVVLHGCRKDY